VRVEFLEDDFREIAALQAEQPVEALLGTVIDQYRQDEVLWGEVEHRHDGEAEAARLELKRRETGALLVSMRSRTVRSEMEMQELRERVLVLQDRHLEQRQRADALRRSIDRLRRRIARLEALLRGAEHPGQLARPASIRQALAHLWRRDG